MNTVTLVKPGEFRHHNTASPGEPGPGEALVQVRRIGVCGTDLHAYRGRQPFFTYPRILGHELGVEVLALGDNAHGIQEGDRCAVEPYLNCGTCVACRRGRTNCCERLSVLGVHEDGGMRERIIVPANKLHRSDTLGLDALALVEMLCIGAHAVGRADPEPGEHVLVIGAGPIGLAVMAFAAARGARVSGMELRSDRRAFASEHLGVRRWAPPGDEGREELVAGSGELPTVVFDATGHAGSMHDAFRFVAHSGTLVFVGLFQGEVTFNDPFFHSHEMTLLSSRNATGSDFEYVIDALEKGLVDVAPWITHRIDLDGVASAFPSFLEPDSGIVKAEIEL